MARLSSPYIVKFFDVFLTHETNDGTDLYYLYIAMEYCPEGDLLEFIQKEKERPFSLKRSVRIFDYLLFRNSNLKHLANYTMDLSNSSWIKDYAQIQNSPLW